MENAAYGATTSGATTKCSSSSSPDVDLSATAFRKTEKRYKMYAEGRCGGKKRCRPSTTAAAVAHGPQETMEDLLRDVVDMRHMDRNSPDNAAQLHVVRQGASGDGSQTWLRHDAIPGLYMAPCALSEEEQLHWCRRSLEDFTRPPFPNNLSTLMKQRGVLHDSAEMERAVGYSKAMRWATLGYSYNWTKKAYDKNVKATFPDDLAAKTRALVASLAEAIPDDPHAQDYRPETAIVNFFPVGTMMMAHQDVSEECLQKPLVSMSFGASAIFLMGTESRDDTPTAFLLRSGDAVVFLGGSRTAYHGVPRVLDDAPEYLVGRCATMKSLRINLNIRQVFLTPQPPDPDAEGPPNSNA